MSTAGERRPPLISTYRVQLTDDFGFVDLISVLPYLKKLGIRTLYLSPVLEAAVNSSHFYDVVDPGRISASLGGEKEFGRLMERAAEMGFSVMLDVVANHMSVKNVILYDVLKRGSDSEFYNYFDIDWDNPECEGKLILPVMESYLDEAVRKGEIMFLENRSEIEIDSLRLPLLKPSDLKTISELNAAALRHQNYLLTKWTASSHDINYRRFFAVNSLIAMNMDRSEVFDHYHEKTFQLVERWNISALRIDHIDGISDPETYFSRIREREKGIIILPEKILSGNEHIPEEWDVDGTTGYDALRMINGLFVDPAGLEKFRSLFAEYSGKEYSSEFYLPELKMRTTRDLFWSEIKTYSRKLLHSPANENAAFGVPPELVAEALSVVIAFLDRYRTYSSKKRTDIEPWASACERATKYAPSLSYEINLVRRFIESSTESGKALQLLERIQTFTGAVMAKSLEDCLMFRYTPLFSMSEVGTNPYGKLPGFDEFFSYFSEISEKGKQTLIPLSTHDSKTGEDLRARLNALSMFPDEFELILRKAGAGEISSRDAYFIQQFLVVSIQERENPGWKDRFVSFIVKSLRESGENTNWNTPDTSYEERCVEFIDSMLGGNLFTSLSGRVLKYGVLNSISQIYLKFMLPGTPDTYQGSEVFNLNFVDPDNRRPVDFRKLTEKLEAVRKKYPSVPPEEILSEDYKLWTTMKLLDIRNRYCDFFHHGRFVAVQNEGQNSEFLISFGYVLNRKLLLVVSLRWHSSYFSKTEEERKSLVSDRLKLDSRGSITDLVTGKEIEPGSVWQILSENRPATVLLVEDHGDDSG